MGAQDFQEYGAGTDPETVFRALVESAAYECGHGGYTGTIAEKGSFIMLEAEPLTWTQAHRQLKKWWASDEGQYTPIKMPSPQRAPSYQMTGYWGNPYTRAATLPETTIDLYDKWGPAGCIEIKRAGIPADVLVRTFGQDVPVTTEKIYRDMFGRASKTIIHSSEKRPPKRGTRFFLFFGFASS